MGMVRCPNCRAVFNALASLADAAGAADAPLIGPQLRFINAGDRVVVDRKYLEETGVHKNLAELQNAAREREARGEARVYREDGTLRVELSSLERAARETPRERDRQAHHRQEDPLRRTPLSLLGGALVPLRNVYRHGARSLVGLATVAFGVVALLLASGFMEWGYENLRESTIRSRLGHLQITVQGYLDEGVANPHAYTLPDAPRTLGALEQLEHVETVAQRLSFTGLASHGEATLSFMGEGVEPAKESVLSGHLQVIAGKPLTAGPEPGILVGAGLADNLGVGPGDSVVLVSKTEAGRINAAEVVVSGIFRSITKAYDDTVIRVPLAVAQELTGHTGAHRWVVLLEETRHADAVHSVLTQMLPDDQYDVVHWIDLAEYYTKVRSLLEKQLNVVRFIIGLIILVSIGNILSMAVAERTAEIGTLMAVGLRKRQVLGIFVGEGVVIGVAGGLLGLVVGTVLALVISSVGIPLPPPPGSTLPVTGEIHVTAGIALGTLALAVVAATLASLYPSWKASRLDIVDALRSGR